MSAVAAVSAEPKGARKAERQGVAAVLEDQATLDRVQGVMRELRLEEELVLEPTLDAVLRRMETPADAAAHLSDELKARYPQIRWRQISDFRNVLAHGYTEIRLDQARAARDVLMDLPRIAELPEVRKLQPAAPAPAEGGK